MNVNVNINFNEIIIETNEKSNIILIYLLLVKILKKYDIFSIYIINLDEKGILLFQKEDYKKIYKMDIKDFIHYITIKNLIIGVESGNDAKAEVKKVIGWRILLNKSTIDLDINELKNELMNDIREWEFNKLKI